MRVVYLLLVVSLAASVGTAVGELLRIFIPNHLQYSWFFLPPLRIPSFRADILIAEVFGGGYLRWNLLTAAAAIAAALWCLRRIR